MCPAPLPCSCLWPGSWSLSSANVPAAKAPAPTAMVANDSKQTCNSDLRIISPPPPKERSTARRGRRAASSEKRRRRGRLNQQRSVKQKQRRRMDGKRSGEDVEGARTIVDGALDERRRFDDGVPCQRRC